MYEHVLLPTDGSIGMTSAIEQCLHQAEQHGATVHALYVVDVRSYVMLPAETQTQVATVLQQQGETAVDHVAERAGERGLEVVTSVVEGVPIDEILVYTAEHDIDLIVMGTHGRTGEAHRVVGSVAEEVIRHAEVPVLTVRKRDEDVDDLDEELLDELAPDIPAEQRRYIG